MDEGAKTLKEIKRIILAMMCLGVIVFGTNHTMAASVEINEFAFNRSVAVQHARAGIEDFGALMMREQQLSAFDFTNPYVAAVLGRDCGKKEINVVLVAFSDKSGSNWAYSHWERNRDGLISRMLSVGFTVEPLDSLVKKARAGGTLCE